LISNLSKIPLTPITISGKNLSSFSGVINTGTEDNLTFSLGALLKNVRSALLVFTFVFSL
jgi:hypothetical protein